MQKSSIVPNIFRNNVIANESATVQIGHSNAVSAKRGFTPKFKLCSTNFHKPPRPLTFKNHNIILTKKEQRPSEN